MALSLVMATLGRVDEIKRFLTALTDQTSRAYELIIVDQNPDDRLVPLVAWATEHAIPIRHVRQAEPNLSAARNLGLAEARHEFIAFPDDDCWYAPDVVEKVLARFAAPDTPDGVILRWEEQDPRGEFPPHVLSLMAWRRFQEVQASSISQFFRRNTLLQLHGFDHTLGLHGWFGCAEETDLMFRALSKGARIAYCPDILVHHHFGTQQEGGIAPSFARYRRRARGTGGIYAKHHLETWVIVRGLLSPWLRACVHLRHPSRAAAHLGTAVGRLEGFLRWKWEHR